MTKTIAKPLPFYRRAWNALRVWRLKRKARALIFANIRDLDQADCGFELRDHISGGRLRRREDEAVRLVAKCRAIEAEGKAHV